MLKISSKKHLILLILLTIPNIGLADDPCASLLAVLNRPTIADSVCAVKPGRVIIESGFQYQKLYPEDGHGINFPETLIRLGLPAGNEISVLMPNYTKEYFSHTENLTGSTATVLGVKHQFPVYSKWNHALDGAVTLPSGNNNFGSNATGVTLNGIINYTVTPAITATAVLGVSSLTSSFNDGGQRYNSFNPDFVLSWQTSENLQFYGEVYGQTKTSADTRDGYNANAGIQYLLTKNIEVDVEYSWRLRGELGGFSQYIGFGGGIPF